MSYNKKFEIEAKSLYDRGINTEVGVDNFYYGEVVSIEDDSDGGRIKVRIADLDGKLVNENLPYCYPKTPRFFHVYPKVGELVWVYIPNTSRPYKGRMWEGSYISQPQKIEYDNYLSALSNTDTKTTKSLESIRLNPDTRGVFPNKEDIGLIGRVNTDIILRENEVEIRAGKHEDGEISRLNKKNPASVRLSFDNIDGDTRSSVITQGNKIAFITHNGNPRFKTNQLSIDDRNRIFENGHPIGRGDVIVRALEMLRKAMVQHIHPYDKLPADKNDVINELNKIDFTELLQRNIVIN